MTAAHERDGASMRPRQVCRGKGRGGAGAGDAVRLRASMRPRQVCRGKIPTIGIGRRRRPGFNEAPASLPGKVATMAARSSCDGRFNEAPASLPGKGEATGRTITGSLELQ